ncbi:hypothetical protein QBC47DRAFT_456076 [Echria macrotheca]|uniref:CUE domain-containing protein n=1 Tax=Echria macrotheca TaxID=438768 RepID=A0AAJ0BLB2_9PEZI|nr:hypothetical protein QBC47DRAFT_456076 [Echria macrotheca]
MASQLPSFALFPLASWRDQLLADEWVACLDAWIALLDSHLSLPQDKFTLSTKDQSLANFLVSFTREIALNGTGILGSSRSAKKLLKECFLLVSRLVQSPSPPSVLLHWDFLADFGRVYGKKRAGHILSHLPEPAQALLDSSLGSLKKNLIKNLDAGISGDIRAVEEQLDRIGDLINASPPVAAFLMAGSDFVDGLINCYKVMNPPLRKVILSTTYLLLVGLAEGQKTSTLTDQLYSLKAAAEAHKSGPLNANDSLVAELVTSTPVLQHLERKLDEAGTISTRAKSILADLATFKKAGSSMPRPKRLVRRKIDKGKGIVSQDEAEASFQQEMHIHRMSQISQVQDLFPNLGSAFISKLLDEYDSDAEQVISHLLDDSLPPHLQSADRSEQLSAHKPPPHFTPHPTPPLLPSLTSLPERKNLYDPEDDDILLASIANLHLGKRHDPAETLPSAAPQKAAILSALAAFDSDDDERDDTYDAADVGGTVDAAGGADDTPLTEPTEAALFRAWQSNPRLFARDAATRRGPERARLRMETHMSDEQVEGWASMLARDGQVLRRLQGRYGEWSGVQNEIESTAWRGGGGGGEDGEDTSDVGSGAQTPRGGGGNRGRGRGRGGRGGGRGGGGSGQGQGQGGPAPDSEAARRRKEANKSSRANHNRRAERAKKMARGGGLPG